MKWIGIIFLILQNKWVRGRKKSTSIVWIGGGMECVRYLEVAALRRFVSTCGPPAAKTPSVITGSLYLQHPYFPNVFFIFYIFLIKVYWLHDYFFYFFLKNIKYIFYFIFILYACSLTMSNSISKEVWKINFSYFWKINVLYFWKINVNIFFFFFSYIY